MNTDRRSRLWTFASNAEGTEDSILSHFRVASSSEVSRSIELTHAADFHCGCILAQIHFVDRRA